jgi:hypothetical protein
MSFKRWAIYKVVKIWPGLFVCKQVTVCPGHVWTTLYILVRTLQTVISAIECAPIFCLHLQLIPLVLDRTSQWTQTFSVSETNLDYVLLGAFIKLRRANISFRMPVYMSVRLSVPMEQLGSHSEDFNDTLCLSFFFFRKSVEKILVSLKSDKNNEQFLWRRFDIYDNVSLKYFYNKNSCKWTL